MCAEGRYVEGEGSDAREHRAAIFIGPEFGTVSRPDLVAAAREARDAVAGYVHRERDGGVAYIPADGRYPVRAVRCFAQGGGCVHLSAPA